MSVRRAAAAAIVLGAVACAPRGASERGQERFTDRTLSGSSASSASCATCHATADVPADAILPGGTLRGVLGRSTYWGGDLDDPRDAINACLFYFMLAPGREALGPDDERGLDLLAYLETLGTEPSEPVAFTIPATLPLELAPGDAARGAIVYDAACRSCHGALHTGEGRLSGSFAPSIPDATIAEHGEYARERTLAKVRWGGFRGIGGAMPPFAIEVLDDASLADLIAYLGV